MRVVILDVETTIKNKGNPFTNGNKLCYTGYKLVGDKQTTIINNLQQGEYCPTLQTVLDTTSFIVGFNLKFDIHWLRKSGYTLNGIRLWDIQYAAFLFSNQSIKYPSLEGTSNQAGFGSKVDVVKTEYWEKDIDTIDIPTEVMVSYLLQDINLTEKLYEYYLNKFKERPELYRLFQLHMEDLQCLIEMEHNGILYDVDQSLKAEKDAEKQIALVEKELRTGYDQVPINFDSVDHVSAYLYGGTISIDSRLPIGVYKTGAKIGQPRYKIVTHEYKLPRIVEPLPKSELKKEGTWSTDDKTLKQLRGTKEAKERISLLDQRAKLEKLRGTYYKGIPKKIMEMEWSNNFIHSSLNQCVAITGRLSSTNPNQQNFAPEIKAFCVSRYDC